MPILLPNAEILCGDTLDVLPNVGVGSVDVVFADPPYNQGTDYGEGAKADRLSGDDYLNWVRQWLTLCRNVLSDEGSLWVLISDEWAAYYVVALGELGLTRRNWIKWYETFGVNCVRKFNRCSRHLLYYVVDPKQFTFNREAVSRPSDRQAKYGDKRANSAGKIWDDVWQIPRLAGTHKERIKGFPTQLPLELLRPIIGCSSNPRDLILDPFSGSATTGVAAIESGRHYMGIEKSEEFCKLSRERLGVSL